MRRRKGEENLGRDISVNARRKRKKREQIGKLQKELFHLHNRQHNEILFVDIAFFV